MSNHLYITDKQLASVLEISESSLRMIIGGFVRGGEGRKTRLISHSVNFANMLPVGVGGSRRWRIDRVAQELGYTEEQVRDMAYGS